MKKLEIENGFIENDYFYFTQIASKGIFRLNMLDGEIEHYVNIPCAMDSLRGRGLKICKWNNCIVVSLGSDNIVWLYNRINDQWSSFFVDLKGGKNVPEMYLFCTYIDGNKMYLLGCHYPAVIILDLISGETKEVPYFDDGTNKAKGRFMYRHGSVRIGEKIYGYPGTDDKILCEFDIKKEKVKWIPCAKNADVIEKIDYRQMQLGGYIFWHEYDNVIIFQDKNYKLHYIEKRLQKEKDFYVQITQKQWEDSLDKKFIQQTLKDSGFLCETDITLKKFIETLADGNI